MAEVELTVAEAYQSDVGKGIVRIDPEVMDELNLKSGDVMNFRGELIIPGIINGNIFISLQPPRGFGE
ncbi:MAG TPA: hypothetical protein EYP47_04830, partial [Methanococcaceae archaeon]|nr:hypothetical protein [Methanococcaceae archaeon]